MKCCTMFAKLFFHCAIDWLQSQHIVCRENCRFLIDLFRTNDISRIVLIPCVIIGVHFHCIAFRCQQSGDVKDKKKLAMNQWVFFCENRKALDIYLRVSSLILIIRATLLSVETRSFLAWPLIRCNKVSKQYRNWLICNEKGELGRFS